MKLQLALDTCSQKDLMVFIKELVNDIGYVIVKCCEMFFVEMNEQSASNA